MSISRRHFLLFSGTTFITVGTSFLPLGTKQNSHTWAKTLNSSNPSLSQMHCSTFETLKDKTFQVFTEGGEQLHLQLEQVDEHGQSKQLEQFSLIFRGPQSQSLPQGTYQIQHRQLGRFSLFLVPTGEPTTNMYYQAAFTRLLV